MVTLNGKRQFEEFVQKVFSPIYDRHAEKLKGAGFHVELVPNDKEASIRLEVYKKDEQINGSRPKSPLSCIEFKYQGHRLIECNIIPKQRVGNIKDQEPPKTIVMHISNKKLEELVESTLSEFVRDTLGMKTSDL